MSSWIRIEDRIIQPRCETYNDQNGYDDTNRCYKRGMQRLTMDLPKQSAKKISPH